MKKRALVRLFSLCLLPFATAVSVCSVIRLSRHGASFPSLAALLAVTLVPVSAAFVFGGRPEKGTDSGARRPGCLFMLFVGMDGLAILMLLLLLGLNIRLLIPFLRAVL